MVHTGTISYRAEQNNSLTRLNKQKIQRYIYKIFMWGIYPTKTINNGFRVRGCFSISTEQSKSWQCLLSAWIAWMPYSSWWEMGLKTCCCSITKLCTTLCNPMDYNTPGFSISPSPGACSNSCPLCQWCHLTVPSPVTPFSSCLQSLPESGSFPVSWLIRWPKY